MEAGAGPLGPGDMSLDRLFVYGTLRPQGQAFDLVESFVVRHLPAVLMGYVLVGEGHRYPWCVESTNGEVVGELLWLADIDSTFDLLDRYEGVDDQHPEYRRVVADVFTGEETLTAWAYVGGVGVPGDATVIEAGDWLMH